MSYQNGRGRPPENELSPFAAAFSAAVAGSGFTLTALHQRLKASGSAVSISTLSYWRSGGRHPEGAQSRVAISELERILGIAAGELSGLLGPARRAGQVVDSGPVFADDYERVLSELVDAVEADPPGSLREISSSTVATAGRRGRLRSFSVRSHLQATAGRVESTGLFLPVEEGSLELPQVRVLRGGRVGRVEVHPSGTMMGARLELDHELRAPEHALLEYEVVLPESYEPQFAVAHGVTRRSVEVLIAVAFPEGDAPDWVAEFEEDGDDERELPRRRLRAPSALAVRQGYGPGYFGVRWGYDA